MKEEARLSWKNSILLSDIEGHSRGHYKTTSGQHTSHHLSWSNSFYIIENVVQENVIEKKHVQSKQSFHTRGDRGPILKDSPGCLGKCKL